MSAQPKGQLGELKIKLSYRLDVGSNYKDPYSTLINIFFNSYDYNKLFSKKIRGCTFEKENYDMDVAVYF